jgi:hypothetical protein
MKMLQGIIFGLLVSSMAYGMEYFPNESSADENLEKVSLAGQAQMNASDKNYDDSSGWQDRLAELRQMVKDKKQYRSLEQSSLSSHAERQELKMIEHDERMAEIANKHEKERKAMKFHRELGCGDFFAGSEIAE